MTADPTTLPKGVSTTTDEKGRPLVRFGSHPAWCDEFEDENGGEHFLADLWHHGAESQRLVLSRHDVVPENTNPEAFVPGEGPETINVFLHQQCDQD